MRRVGCGLHQRDLAALGASTALLYAGLVRALAVPVRLGASLAQRIRLHHGARLPRGFVLRRVLVIAPRALLGDAPLHRTPSSPCDVRLRLRARAPPRGGGASSPRARFLRRHELQFQLDVLQLGAPGPISNSASTRRRASASSSSITALASRLSSKSKLSRSTSSRHPRASPSSSRPGAPSRRSGRDHPRPPRALVLVEIKLSSSSPSPPSASSDIAVSRADGFGLGADDGFRRSHLARQRGRSGRERLLARPDILARRLASISLTRCHGSAPKPLAVPLHAALCGATSLGCSDNNGWNTAPRVLTFKIGMR